MPHILYLALNCRAVTTKTLDCPSRATDKGLRINYDKRLWINGYGEKWLRTKDRSSRASVWTISIALIVYSFYPLNSARVQAEGRSLATFGTYSMTSCCLLFLIVYHCFSFCPTTSQKSSEIQSVGVSYIHCYLVSPIALSSANHWCRHSAPAVSSRTFASQKKWAAASDQRAAASWLFCQGHSVHVWICTAHHDLWC